MTPITGTRTALRISGRERAELVLHATTIAFTPFFSKNRAMWVENRVTASFDFEP
jgi:hypothetical protein